MFWVSLQAGMWFLRGNTQRQLIVSLLLETDFLAKNQLPSQASQWISVPGIAHLNPSEAEWMLCPVRQLKLYLQDSEQIRGGGGGDSGCSFIGITPSETSWEVISANGSWRLSRRLTHELTGSTTKLQHMRSEPCKPHGLTVTVRWCSGGRREYSRIPIYVKWPVSLMGCQLWVQWWSHKSWIQDISHLLILHDLYAATDMVIERIYLKLMLLSSSNQKYPSFPLFSYFSGLCAWDVCYIIFCHLLYIYYQKTREFVFISIVQFMMSANCRIRFGLQIVFVCLYITPSHYHHCANFIWRHWTYTEMPVRYNLSSVWVRLSIFSQLLYNMWGCVFSVYPFPLWWLREYIYFVLLSSSNRKYEVLPIV